MVRAALPKQMSRLSKTTLCTLAGTSVPPRPSPQLSPPTSCRPPCWRKKPPCLRKNRWKSNFHLSPLTFVEFFGEKAFDFYLLQALQFDHDDPVEMKYK